MRVDFRVTAVGGKRQPFIAETRIAGKGQLAYSKSPNAGVTTPADTTTGLVVVEYDELTSGDTGSLKLRVFAGDSSQGVAGDDFAHLGLSVIVVGSNDKECATSKKGSLDIGIQSGHGFLDLELPACHINWHQQAALGPKSRIHMTITSKCLRTPQAAGKPLCGGLKLASGAYRIDTTAGGNHFPGTWNLTVSGSQVTGTSTWSCCPGPRHDPLTGTVSGRQIVITRDCTGQGYVGACSQKYTGTLVGSGRVEGTWRDVTGSTGSGTFTLVKT